MTMILRDLKMAFRLAVLVVSFALGVVALIACAKTASATTINPVIVLTTGTFTAGDLFQGLDADKAARVLGPAPAAGKDMVLNAVTIMRVASALGLDWRPQSGSETVTVRSAASIVEETDITDLLSERLRNEGIDNDFVLSYMGAAPRIILPHTVDASAEIVTFNYNPKADKFTAVLAAPTRENALTRMEVSGFVDHLIEVPVLKTLIRAGDIIGADDVDWIAMPHKSLQHDTIIQADKLIGKTARRMLETGKPVRGAELQMPQLVNRGDNVTIVYQDGPISLTAKGKALDGGAFGQPVRVVNVNSNRSIDAIVNDMGIVTVSSNQFTN